MRLKRVLEQYYPAPWSFPLAACGGGGDAETTAASKAEERPPGEAAKETEAEKRMTPKRPKLPRAARRSTSASLT